MSTAIDAGRKPLLTPAVSALIVQFVSGGSPLPTACEAAGVKWGTAKRWVARGRKGDEPYASFVDGISQAKALRRAALELVITNSAQRGDWRAAVIALDREQAQQEHNARLRLQRHGGRGNDRVILLYPVPVPLGAELSQLRLVPGHAIDTAGCELDAAPDDDGGR
jgi:hypothetical protein